MISAAIFIVLGLLILFFPSLLSIIVGVVLIVAGISIGLIAYDFRRTRSMHNTRFVKIILSN